MGLFDFFKASNINDQVEEYKNTEGAFLIDVRNPNEYKTGHIPESRNIPVSQIQTVEKIVKEKDAPVYLYCASGGRSSQAASVMKRLGYTNVQNMGSIRGYTGGLKR